MNKSYLITALIVTSLLLASLSFAGPMGGRGGDCPGWERNPAVEQLPQEKKDLLRTLLTAHRQDTQPLRDSMWEKRTLLKALSHNPNTTPETITALVKEMSTLRQQLQAKRDSLQARVAKDIGIELPPFFDGAGKKGRHGRDGHGQRFMERGPAPDGPMDPDA